MYKALTIAGSDSGGGAGIQADLKTFAALGVYGSSVITAVTAQNTVEVAAIAEVPEEVVIAQIDTVVHDIGADAAKTGMLSSASIIQNVADRLEAWGIPHLVVDPVMVSKGGVALLQPDAVDALKRDLLPFADIITPNISEAEVLAGRQIASPAHAQEAAKAIAALGPKTVVVKGGHLPGSPIDLVFHDGQFTPIEGTRVDTQNTHGTGCTFSAAITAFLARGYETMTAIQLAKSFIQNALEQSYAIGEGHSPVNHFAELPEDIRAALDGARK
ncbi:MAG: bifunctional hydroxymethylpyrimidine kinase/phosphomethylpyrimidine kinase [Thermomicrobiales bacterium]|nr:bifunctional hydroxymethylpyrimidine kinase/phosphomethylpyrimidine kinase [Thermomicrobiales bacterium]MCO5223731.1 bifunctional hydroxymethylpyrimidine kinase/phosphomethylpyrimidine kinase [Thermomicrobiales bacterium]